MKISYNLMNEDDVNGVLAITNLCFSTPWSKSSITGELNNPLAKYIIAKDLESNSIVGFVGAWIVVGEADITNIAVHPNYRNLGIGSKLPYDPGISLLVIYTREIKLLYQRDICTSMFIVVLFIITKDMKTT